MRLPRPGLFDWLSEWGKMMQPHYIRMAQAVVLATGTLLMTSNCGHAAIDCKRMYQRYVVEGGFETRCSVNEEADAVTIDYRYSAEYPSLSSLQYYDSKLPSEGWIPSSDGADRTWGIFVDGTIRGEPVVHQLIAAWRNADKSRMIYISVRYYSVYEQKGWHDKPNNNVQCITVTILPYQDDLYRQFQQSSGKP